MHRPIVYRILSGFRKYEVVGDGMGDNDCVEVKGIQYEQAYENV